MVCKNCGKTYYVDIEIAKMIDFKLCETCQDKIKKLKTQLLRMH